MQELDRGRNQAANRWANAGLPINWRGIGESSQIVFWEATKSTAACNLIEGMVI